MNKTYFHYLDFLRILAAIFVLLVHARCEIFCEYSLLNQSSQNIGTILFFSSVGFGLEGVMILFVLSGFLVGGRNLDQLFIGKQSGRRFVINRLSRILPPLIGALMLSSLVKIIRGVDLSGWSIVGNLLGLQLIAPGVNDEIGVLWTIPYEVWFYVSLLALIMLIGHNKRYLLGLSLLALCFCMFLRLEMQYVFLIVIGVVGYFCRDYIPRSKSFLLFVSLGLITTKGIGVLANSGHAFHGPLAGIIDNNILFFLEGFFIALLTLRMAVSLPNTKLQVVIDAFGRKLAPISYSLFLTHFSVLELFQHYVGRRADVDVWGVGLFIFESFVCVVVACFFFILIEKNTKQIEVILTSVFDKNLK